MLVPSTETYLKVFVTIQIDSRCRLCVGTL